MDCESLLFDYCGMVIPPIQLLWNGNPSFSFTMEQVELRVADKAGAALVRGSNLIS